MDPHERQLLDAIRADPEDDNARMVYADWLLERGDPYGELIAAGLAGDVGRIGAVLRVHEQALAARLPAWAAGPYYVRGMIASFSTQLGVARVLARAAVAELIALAPIPLVWTAPKGEPFHYVLVRGDGKVAAVLALDAGGGRVGIEILEVPDGRVLASEVVTAAMRARGEVWDLDPLGDGNRLRFARDGDVFRYELAAGRRRELAFAPPRPG
jgi:uncharacterized protein (TIGR02996 family)